MREKVILICAECLSRNYTVTRAKGKKAERIVLRKYCPRCRKYTLHRETK